MTSPEAPSLREDHPVLIVEGLRKVFSVKSESSRHAEEFVAVDDVSFTLRRSGALAIVGESGSGKTTVVRMIAGLETPTSGGVRLSEVATSSASRRVRRRRSARQVQMVFQDPYSSLNPKHTVGGTIGDVLKLHFPTLNGHDRRARVLELLGQVGLDERHMTRLPRALSGGQRQRVAIARALACEPDVLILDEAVSALDVSVQGQILNLLSDLRSAIGVAYLFVSHDLAVVRQVCDDVIVMRRGVVVDSGPTDVVLSDPSADYTRRLLSAVPRPGWKPSRRIKFERSMTRLVPLATRDNG